MLLQSTHYFGALNFCSSNVTQCSAGWLASSWCCFLSQHLQITVILHLCVQLVANEKQTRCGREYKFYSSKSLTLNKLNSGHASVIKWTTIICCARMHFQVCVFPCMGFICYWLYQPKLYFIGISLVRMHVVPWAVILAFYARYTLMRLHHKFTQGVCGLTESKISTEGYGNV